MASNKQLDFGSDPDHVAIQEILKDFYHCMTEVI